MRRTTAPWALLAFFITLPLVISFDIVGIRLTPIRLFLLISFLPALVLLLSGRAGRVLGADFAMGAFGLWVVISLLVNDGLGQLPNAVMTAIELSGGYLLGRVLIRNAYDYRLMTRIYLGCLLALLPFAVYEFTTGRILLHEIYAHFGETAWKPSSSTDRWGFARTMSGFEHPILYGLYCSILASTIYYSYGRSRILALPWLGLIVGMTFLSLSSAPLLSLLVQAGLITWGKITKGRWLVLIVLAVLAYLAVVLFSHRTPITILINYVTFDSETAWTRIAQWQYGSKAALDNPVLGLGMGAKWATVARPSWLSDSIDDFWLLNAMRYGLVGLGFLVLAIGLLLAAVTRTRGLPPLLKDYRTGYVIGIAGLAFVLATVHIWGAVSVFAFFFLGSGAWLTAAGDRAEGETGTVTPETLHPTEPAARGARPTTRFAQDRTRPRTGVSQPATNTMAHTAANAVANAVANKDTLA